MPADVGSNAEGASGSIPPEIMMQASVRPLQTLLHKWNLAGAIRYTLGHKDIGRVKDLSLSAISISENFRYHAVR